MKKKTLVTLFAGTAILGQASLPQRHMQQRLVQRQQT